MTFEKLWDDLLSSYTNYELLNNGYDIENCDRGYLYLNKKDKTFIEVGYKRSDVVYLAFRKEI